MRRGELLDRLRFRERWDLVVIGGGATGLGTAVDAVSRGYRTLLIEANDFAKATSSRSTKLIHGGVRYLAQGNISLVREALFEQGLLLKNAPHLVHDLPFVVPGYSTLSLPYYGLGLRLYDLLAGRLTKHQSRRAGVAETLRLLPTLEPKDLRGSIVYHDCQFDDARLSISLMRTAEEQGGVLANYVRAIGFLQKEGRISGVRAEDAETGETFEIEARAVVNATGVFADEVRRLEDPAAPPMIRSSQGVHIVLDRAFLPGEAALMVPKTDDGRVLFAIPWGGRVLVGTTDTPTSGPEIEPRPQEAEIDFLLQHAARYLTRKPERSDAKSVFAGLRPLLGKGKGGLTAKLSREHAVVASPQGLVTIAGGKWTTYRRMGEDAVQHAADWAGLPRRPCMTDSLALHGWTESLAPGFAGRYGSDAPALEKLAQELPGGGDCIHPNLPYKLAEVVWAARYEAARTVEDVLARRTRALVLDAKAAGEAAPRVAEILALELDRSPEWQATEIRNFQALAQAWS